MLFDRTSGYLIETRTNLVRGVAASITANTAVENDKRALTGSSTSALISPFP